MLSNDLKYVNVTNKKEAHTAWKKNCNFEKFFFNWIISVMDRAKFTKFGTHVVKGHSEGTVSQIFYLGPSVYFMKSRKLSSKN